MLSTKHTYALLCVLGTVLPVSQFVIWVRENGLNPTLAIQQVASDRLSSFAWLDVVVTVIVIIVFILKEGRAFQRRHIVLPILAGCCIGASLALPLFLYFREDYRQTTDSST